MGMMTWSQREVEVLLFSSRVNENSKHEFDDSMKLGVQQGDEDDDLVQREVKMPMTAIEEKPTNLSSSMT